MTGCHLRADLLVIDRPEAVESKGFLITTIISITQETRGKGHTIGKSYPSHPSPGSQRNDQSA